MAEFVDLLEYRIVQIDGTIDDECANVVIAQFLFLQKQDESSPITMRIESHGGSITASLAILDTMRFVKCPVITECREVAAGAAVILFATGARGQRRASHHASFGFCRTASGNPTAPDAPHSSSFLESLQQRLVAELASSCGQEASRVAEDMNAERWFTAAEAIEYGLADKELPSHEP